MVKPTYPGVYIVEDPSTVHTITPVATSITAFLGRTSQGPVNKPVRLHSLGDFYNTFGPAVSGSELATSVQLFFQNGGTDCYVVRLMNGGNNASTTLKNEAGDTEVLKFTAKDMGALGNQLVLQIDYDTPSPEDTFHLHLYQISSDGKVVTHMEDFDCSMDWNDPHFAPDFITQNSKYVKCELESTRFPTLTKYKIDVGLNPCYSESGLLRDTSANEWIKSFITDLNTAIQTQSKFVVNVDGTRYVIDLSGITFAPSVTPAETDITKPIQDVIDTVNQNALQGKISVEFKPDATNKVTRLNFVLSDKTQNKIVIEPAPANDIAGFLMLGTENGGIEVSRTSHFRPAPNGLFFDLSKLNDFAVKTQQSITKITLDGEPVSLNLITTVGGDPLYKGKNGNVINNDGIREKISMIKSSVQNDLSDWIAYVAGSRLVFNKKNPLRNYTGSISTSTTDVSAFFKQNTAVYSIGIGSGNYVTQVAKGTDGDAPGKNDYLGDQNIHTGFYALDTVDLFNIMVVPRDDTLSNDDYESLWAPASNYCKSRRAFLIIEPPTGWQSNGSVLDPSSGIRKLRRGLSKDYAAVYYPRLYVPGPNGLKIKVNPGGAIAGLMARTDAAIGVWKAPAGLDADIQGGNFDLDVLLTDLENGDLNQEGINCLRQFPSGLICWGARTMDGADDFGSQWKYIPIRRLALMIEESLYRGTQWVVFQPNDDPLWAKIRLNVGSFMMQLFRQGAFQGSTPDKAFFVKCDGNTTTQADRDQGIVNIIVGFAPLKPAEFVIIHIQQIAGDL